MAQYATGSVTVTQGSATVAGTGTEFLSNVEPGDIFTIPGLNYWYEVASVDSDTQLTLTQAFQSADQTDVTYAVTTSFTSFYGWPYPEQGDIETGSLFKRAVQQIEQTVKVAAGAISIPLRVDEGGTGTQSLTQGAIVVGQGTNPLQTVGALSKGSLLVGQGSNNNPMEANVGADGLLLSADSTTSTGLKWIVVPALQTLDGVRNDGGDIDLVAGGAITITPDDGNNQITISETHSSRTDNPHGVTKTQVGLGNVTDALQLVAANNLSDLTNVTTARSNLGLGSMALQDKGSVSITGGTATLSTLTATTSISVDAINEYSSGVGVTVDGVTLKDGGFSTTANSTVGGDLTVTGNMTVEGTLTTKNANEVDLGDNIIVLNSGETGSPSLNAGIEVERGDANNVRLIWDEAADIWRPQSYDGSSWVEAQFGYVADPTSDDHVGDRGYNDSRYLQISNNLSEVVASTARSNLSVPSQTAFNNHLNDQSNPHAVTATQVGALASLDGVSNAGGDVDLVASGNINITPDDGNNQITIGTAAEINSAANRGSSTDGEVLYQGKSGTDLEFKRIKVTGPTVNVSSDSNRVLIDVDTVPDGEALKVSSDDTNSNYLASKVVAGNHVAISTLNGGGDETLQIAVTDGPGSGLNADKLDGNHASAFLGANEQAVDADKLDGKHASDFDPAGEALAMAIALG